MKKKMDTAYMNQVPDKSVFFIFLRGNEGDPLSPPEGEAAQGCIPLTPSDFFLFPGEFLSTCRSSHGLIVQVAKVSE
jgi:hypothetical protein